MRDEHVIHSVVRQGLRVVELRRPRPERRRGAVFARLVDRRAAPAERQARRASECRCLQPRRTSGGERGQPAAETDGPVEDVEGGLRAEPLQRYQRLRYELGRDHIPLHVADQLLRSSDARQAKQLGNCLLGRPKAAKSSEERKNPNRLDQIR